MASVAFAWLIAALLGAYEVFVNLEDTVVGTVVAVATGMAAATGITLLIIATVEVFMVLYRRVNERRLAAAREEGVEEGIEKGVEKGREEERRRLQEWYANLPQEFRDQWPSPF